ncbi:unnamed protein product [Ilex paraguariensis]|uniref:Uncharacterized protein n=1 Tax=Ilex paraguariensis TaxID=185542 RepID=A0ABC8R7A1_9AQUA
MKEADLGGSLWITISKCLDRSSGSGQAFLPVLPIDLPCKPANSYAIPEGTKGARALEEKTGKSKSANRGEKAANTDERNINSLFLTIVLMDTRSFSANECQKV